MTIEVAAPVVEFLSFDRTTAGVKASGSITLTGVGADGDTITISDSKNIYTLELDDDGEVTAGNRLVDISEALDEDDTKAALIAVINGLDLDITASDGGAGVVDLDADFKGTSGNETVLNAVDTGGVIAVTGMSSGTNAALTVGMNDTVGTEEFRMTRYKDGRIRFTNANGVVRDCHSDNYLVAELFEALKAVVAA